MPNHRQEEIKNMSEEMVNQPIETSESEDFVIEEAIQDTEESSEETTTNETPVEEQTEEPTDDFDLEIKYNGSEEHLTREQAIELAQKGKNYDKIYERLQNLQNDPIRQVFEEQARRAGLTVEEYANRIVQFQNESDINRIARDFKEKNPDATDEIAEQYARAEHQNRMNQRQQELDLQRQQMEQSRQEQARNEVLDFQKVYPDVDIAKLPKEVIDDINSGTSLMSAYRAYEISQLKTELSALRKNEENKSRSVGALNENNSNESGEDPFLTGLLK